MKQKSLSKSKAFQFFYFFTFLTVSNFAFGQVSVTATAGTLGPTNYTTLKLAFDAVNLGTHRAAITIGITANTTETASASLNASGVGAAVYSAINISPSGGAARTITGALGAGAPTILFNGADNVTINGLNSLGNSLTISNTTVANTMTVRFLNDASGNTITNCTVLGSGTSNGNGVISIAGGTSTGNDNNTISNCIIAPAGLNLPTVGIYILGTSLPLSNDNGTINNNIVQDYFNPSAGSAGIFFSGNCSGWTVTSNKLFQTATRTTTGPNLIHRGIDVTAANATTPFNVINNTIGFANANGTGKTIYTGATTSFLPILVNTTTTITHSVQGNTISGINFTTASTATGAQGFFCGIFGAGAINLSGNLIGSTTATDAIVIECTATPVAQGARFSGVYISTVNASSIIQNNTVSGISTIGGPTFGYSFVSFFTTGTGGIFNISDNNVGNAILANAISTGTAGVTTTGTCNIFGFYNTATGNPLNINNNFVRNCSVNGSGGSSLTGIQSQATITGGTININNNLFENLSNTGSQFVNTIINNNATGNLTIDNNTIRNITLSNASSPMTAIFNSGVVTGQLNITNNKLGDASNNFVTATAAHSGTFQGIINSGGSNTCALTITGNNFQRISHNVPAISVHNYISNTAATLSQNISSNTFTNLNVNTSGAVTMIANSVILPATGTQTVSNNSIVTGFTKSAANGNIVCFTTAAVSTAGTTITNSTNNFSNITVSGTSAITGWIQMDSGLTNKIVNSNTFSNWTAGSGNLIGLTANGFSGTASLSSNIVSNLNTSGSIQGIVVGAAGNASVLTVNLNSITNLTSAGTLAASTVAGLTCSNNSTIVNISNTSINTLTTAAVGAGFVYGINQTGGTGTTNISNNVINALSTSALTGSNIIGLRVAGTIATSNVFKNKIYNLSATTSAAPVLIGLAFTAGTTLNAYNNLITDIRVTSGNNGIIDVIQGMLIANSTTSPSNANVSYNTVLLTGSGGANFTTSGLFHRHNNTATTGTLFLRNNIITNKCTPSGTGLTIGIRRDNASLNNYSTDSNSNLIYANNPSLSNVIYFDGTNRRQTMGTFKAAVGPARESNSETEDVVFLSTSPVSLDFLRVSIAAPTFTESNGINVAGITDDFIGTIRFGNPGYIPTIPAGTDPDIGAYEIQGTKPSGTVVVSGAVVGNGDYSSVSLAFAAINGGAQNGASITVRIYVDINESTSTAVLNAGLWSSIDIRPQGNRRVFGATTAGLPLLDFNGADNVTINGVNNGINSLILENTTVSITASTSTIRFINDATNNSVTNCSIKGASNMAVATAGGTVFFSTGATTGNDGNIISNCDIGPSGANLPSKSIFSLGTNTSIAVCNSGITITDCNLFDNFLTSGSAAIYAAAGNTNWTITNNKIYQTSPRAFTAVGTLTGVFFENLTFGTGVIISGNTIGYASNTASGTTTLTSATVTPSFTGILFGGQSTIATPNDISNNIISNITLNFPSSIFNGITNSSASGTNVVSISLNTIRNIDLQCTTTSVTNGITAGGAAILTVSGNTINGISQTTSGTLNGIISNLGLAATFSGNTISNLSSTGASVSNIYGIRQTTSGGAKTYTSNNISNLSGTTGSNIYGISNESGDAASTISLNTINTLTSTGGTSPIVVGINKTSTAINDIFRNKVFDLSSTANTAPAISGILSGGLTGTTNISNNIIGDLRAINANATNPINGINIINGTTINVYYNSVFLNATGGVTLFGSSAIFATTGASVNFRNNIFVNNSTFVGAGRAAAYRRNSTTLTSYAAASNNNCFFSATNTIFTDGTNTDVLLSSYKSRVATRDSNSISYEPTFISTVGSNANFLLFDIAVANAIKDAGAPISGFTIDFQNETRDATMPDIGADEIINIPQITTFNPAALCISGGQTVTITGVYLNTGGIPTVLFDGVAGTVLSNSPTTITVTTPASLTGSTFTVITTIGTSAPSSPVYTIDPAAVGGTLSADQIICPNTKPSDITLSGSLGTIVWQRSITPGFVVPIIIAGETSATLTGANVPNLTAPKNYIRAVLTSGSCETFSPSMIVTTATVWNGTVWSDGIPTTSIGAIINGNLTVSSALSACDLVINTGATVNVDPLIAITLQNQINVNGTGRVNFNDTSSLFQVNSAIANTGNIYYRRRTSIFSTNYDFCYWGSPVNNQLLGRIWMSANNNDTFYKWDIGIPNWVPQFGVTPMIPGVGYIARSRNGTTGVDSDGNISPLFLTGGTWLADFKGIPNNGNINVNVGAIDNLISNPYPSAIDIKTFAADVSNATRLSGIFQFWTHNTAIAGNAYTENDYATYSTVLNIGTVAQSGGIAPDQFVDAGQGFFAEGASAGTVTFKNIHRVSGNNNAFYRTSNGNANAIQSEPEPVLESHRFWLNLSNNNGLFKQQLITYTESATNGYNMGLDAPTFEGNANIDFYSIMPGYKFTIQSRRLPLEVNDVVNLGYKTTVAGTFTIATDHFDGIFNTQDYYLRDNSTGIVHDIKKNPYNFTTAAGTFENRFQIIYEYICAQTTMWDGERWSNGLPSLTKGAIIFNDFTATADLEICTLEIIGAAIVTIPSGLDIKVQHTINVTETANLIFENNANLIQISEVSNKGNITVKRNVDLRRLEYTYWSSPVFNQNLLEFSPQTIENRFATYNETTNAFVNVLSPGTQSFLSANGYSVRAPNNFLPAPSTFTGIFRGVPANGDFEFAGTNNNQGYNLTGNPYPSTIDANLFIQENPSTLYFLTKAALNATISENYATFTNLAGTAAIAGGVAPNGTIQIGQGFFCKIPISKMITFNNKMRVGNNSNQFFRVAPALNSTPTISSSSNSVLSVIEKHRIWLNLTSASKQFNQIAIGYMTGATTGFDVGIDGNLYSDSATSLYSLIDNQSFSIQGRMLPFVASDIVRLGFKTDVSGVYSITIDHLDGLFAANQEVYLKDNLLGTFHNIKQSAYNFLSETGTFNNRFEITYNSVLNTKDLSIENTISVIKIKEKVIVKSPLEKISKVLVFDILGRKLLNLKAINKNNVEIENLSISEQTLIVKVILDNGQSFSKKIIF